VASVAADRNDRVGVPADSPGNSSSYGPGSGGGVGSGSGLGLGDGQDGGIGSGSGGGTGGGPYRAGAGISPPQLLREIRANYTDEARKKAIEGDVVLEIVVKRDGSVGQVRVLHSLGGGLEQKAVDAVRQWKFSPALRHGAPVDVVVEASVGFKLR
jgi:TonB family protein